MSNSSLVSFTKISPFKTSPRNHKIDTITIHCMAGNLSIETCGNLFCKTGKNSSSNYGIGSDGRIGLYVEEKDRSWCSSNKANDHRAITIEVANDEIGGDWHVSDKALNSLIELLADICKRNNIKKLLWKADKNLIGKVEVQNMTVHRWFANKSCPGNYLFRKHSYITEKVNELLGNENLDVQKEETTINSFKVRVSVGCLNIRQQPGIDSKITGQIKDKGVYTIIESTSTNGILWYKLKSGAGWICATYTNII